MTQKEICETLSAYLAIMLMSEKPQCPHIVLFIRQFENIGKVFWYQ